MYQNEDAAVIKSNVLRERYNIKMSDYYNNTQHDALCQVGRRDNLADKLAWKEHTVGTVVDRAFGFTRRASIAHEA